jgi:hypothetical protein
MKAILVSVVVICLLIGAQSVYAQVQAFKTKTSFKDGYDAGYFIGKAGKSYEATSSNHTAKYKVGYDFGYRDGSSGSKYDPVKKYANKDSEQEDGLPYDAQGRACLFGPGHDLCYETFQEGIPGTPNYKDYQSGYKVGHADALAGVDYDTAQILDMSPSLSWQDGYVAGWNDGHNGGSP